MKTFSLCVTVLSAMSATTAIAADMLPLKQGIYVDKRVDCSEFSNASMMSFWGDQLNVAQVIGHIVQVSKSGNEYRLKISGEPVNGDGPAQEVEWTVTVYSKKEMKVQSEFGVDRYRWCFDKVP